MAGEERDIILLLGSGGMTGIFTAGALEVIDRKYRDRIHSIYATSSGADVGVYLAAGQADVPRRFFIDHLATKQFIRGNWLSYIWKVFVAGARSRVPDFIDVDYVVSVARDSDCALDLAALKHSPIGLFVKVIRIRDGQALYLDAKNDLFQALKATFQCGPFTSAAVEIDGESYIDGDTIISTLDEDIARQFPNKTIVYIEPADPAFGKKLLLYPFYLLAGFATMKLYGLSLGACYIRELFTDPSLPVRKRGNVVYLESRMSVSMFSTDLHQLTILHRHGVEEAERLLVDL